MKPEEGIKVKSINFNKPLFRKLKNCQINIADRITLIAGHNGIGKSTILGLLSNTFGLTNREYKNYFGEPYYSNIERIIYIALNEVDQSQKQPNLVPTVEAKIGQRTITKRCSLTRRNEWKRARIVPRTVDPLENDEIGPDAKIPLPTIYLGTRRLASIGEADEKEVSSEPYPDMNDLDRKYIADFINSVIIGGDATTDIKNQHIKGIKKSTAHPDYKDHESLAISMGQDSLGSIATALASFNYLKREMNTEYQGGLLIIDEIDIGFHPHAIKRLVKSLKTSANNLKLQIIATTHSPCMIESLHPQGGGNERSPDSVVYLVDTKRPRLAEDQSLKAILNDMSLESEVENESKIEKKENLCVYFEDEEALQFFETLIPRGKRGAISRKTGKTLKPIALGIGGTILVSLPNSDPIFRDRLLVVDSDTPIPTKSQKHGNIIKIPCTPKAQGTNRSPENSVKNFLRRLKDSDDEESHKILLKLKIKNPSSDKIADTFFKDGDGDSPDRVKSKTWWRKHWNTLKSWGVLEAWCLAYPDQQQSFQDAFEKAALSLGKK